MPNYGLDYTFQTHRPEVDAITDFFAKRKAENDRQETMQKLADTFRTKPGGQTPSMSTMNPDELAGVVNTAKGSPSDYLGILQSRDAAKQKLDQEKAMKEFESQLTQNRETAVNAPRLALDKERIESANAFRNQQEQDRVSQESDRTRYQNAELGIRNKELGIHQQDEKRKEASD